VALCKHADEMPDRSVASLTTLRAWVLYACAVVTYLSRLLSIETGRYGFRPHAEIRSGVATSSAPARSATMYESTSSVVAWPPVMSPSLTCCTFACSISRLAGNATAK
jgi:hypothetical protein